MKGSYGTSTSIKGRAARWNKKGGKCPSCYSSDNPKNGILKKRKSKFGWFLGCSRYPLCKYTQDI